MVPIYSVSRPLLLVAVLFGLVLLVPASLALDANVNVPGGVASLDAQGVDPMSTLPQAPVDTGDTVDVDPEALIRTVHATGSGALPTGLPTDALIDPGATEQVTDDTLSAAKSSRRASTQSSETPVWHEETASNGAMALGGAGLFGLLFWAKNALGLAGSRFLLAPLFSRIDKNDMLDNEGREMLYNLIQTNPGISLTQLADRASLGWGTTVYHLGRLEQAGFVSSMRQGQTRHFFEKGKAPVTQRSAIAVLKNQTAGDMARFVLAQPGATQSAIGQALGIKAPVVTKYVKRLAGEGLVSVEPEGRSKVITPTSELSSVMLSLEAPSGTLGVAQPHLGQGQIATAA